MLKRLVEVTDAIYLAKDRDSLFEAIAGGCASFGFGDFLMFCHKPTKQEMILNATFTNFSRSFLDDYERLDWAADDFMLDLVLEKDRPLVWDTSEARYDEARKQSYIDFIHSCRLLTGVVVPLKHRPQTFSALAVSSVTGLPLAPGTIDAVNVMANAAMTKAEMLGLCEEVSPDATKSMQALSAVQHEVLSWVAEGKSNLDIATILDVNERAVRYHVTEILRKLGVATRMQAAAIRRSSHFDPKA